MKGVDFDFQRYVERRRGARQAEAREGASYAYAGDLRILKTLDRVTPVKVAIEATVRMWRSLARAELLAGAVKASPTAHPALHALAQRCADILHIAPPTLYVSATAEGAHTFGTDDDAYLVLEEALAARLTELELAYLLGHECGHLQNDHVVFATAHYYLTHFANRFLRWVVTPALLALSSWRRRAEITCDRAGLICARDLDAAEGLLRKLAPTEEWRAQALRVFAESAYYRGLRGDAQGGLTPEECDAQVAEILSR